MAVNVDFLADEDETWGNKDFVLQKDSKINMSATTKHLSKLDTKEHIFIIK